MMGGAKNPVQKLPGGVEPVLHKLRGEEYRLIDAELLGLPELPQ